jgi:flagellar basal-body rod modification protein FlgD
MSIASIESTPPAGTTSGLTGGQEVNQQQFLMLLVNQLKAQDPFDPVDNQQFLAQLATFSQLEEQQKATGALQSLVALQGAQLALGGLSQAASLVGRQVTYSDPVTGEERQGVVTRVSFDPEGVMVEVGGQSVPAGHIISVGGPAPAPPPAGAPGSQGPPVPPAVNAVDQSLA